MNTRSEVLQLLNDIREDLKHGMREHWNMSEPGSTRVRYTAYAFQIRMEVEVLVTIGTVKWKVDRFTHQDPLDLTEGWRLTNGGFGDRDAGMNAALQFAIREIELGLDLSGRPAYLPQEIPPFEPMAKKQGLAALLRDDEPVKVRTKRKATPKKVATIPEKPHTIRVRYQGDTYHAIDDKSWKKCTCTDGHSKAVWNLLAKQGLKQVAIKRAPELEKGLRDPKRSDHEQWQVYRVTPISDLQANANKEISAMNEKFLEQVKDNNAQMATGKTEQWSGPTPDDLALTDAIADPTTALLQMHDQENAPVIPELKEAQPPKPVTLAELARPFGKDKREREAVKKRFRTLHGKLQLLPADQRRAFLKWMELNLLP